MRLHTKLSPSECIERLQWAATRKEAIGNPRYRFEDGTFRLETEVDGMEFSVYLLGRGRYNSSPHRSFRLNGRIARRDWNGGSEISARLPWTQFLLVGIVLLILLAALVYIMVDFPAQQKAYLAPYPKMVALDKYGHVRNPQFNLALSLIVFPVLMFLGIYFPIQSCRLLTDFLRDLLEAEKLG